MALLRPTTARSTRKPSTTGTAGARHGGTRSMRSRRHCARSWPSSLGGGAVTPPLKWQKRRRGLLVTPGAIALLRELLLDVDTARLRDVPVEWTYLYKDPSQNPSPMLRDRNALLVRGGDLGGRPSAMAAWKAERLAELGVMFGTSGRTNNVARDERIANTCAAALGTLDDAACFAALGLMKARVTNRNVSKQIARALETAAARRGMSPSELLELSIPTMGGRAAAGGDDRRRGRGHGDRCGRRGLVRVARSRRGHRASPPRRSSTRCRGGAPLKEEAKERKTAMALERGRIEDLFVEDREWDIETWRQRYVRHPLSGPFGRRLVWRLVDGSASRSVMPSEDGSLVAADGSGVEAGDGALIRLWHPIDADEDRCRPPGERPSSSAASASRSSRRFARYTGWRQRRGDRHGVGPIRGPHPALLPGPRADAGPALGHELPGSVRRRGDRHRQGRVPEPRPARRVPARRDLAARAGPQRGHALHDGGGPFRADGGRRARGPEGGPAIVFSEAMRDVDLFVSVSSVGADGTGRSAAAATPDQSARCLLEPLLRGAAPGHGADPPRRARAEPSGLAIADRCDLGERWLEVRGDLRTYRIHLGSANVTMEPGRHLPADRAEGRRRPRRPGLPAVQRRPDAQPHPQQGVPPSE